MGAKRVDRSVEVTSGRRPGRAVPLGDERGVRVAGGEEVSAGVQVGAGGVERVDFAVHAIAEGVPGLAVPSGDVIGVRFPCGGEPSAGVQVRAVVRQRVDAGIFVGGDSGAEVGPRSAVPCGDVVGGDASDGVEFAADVELAPDGERRHDVAVDRVDSRAERRPGFAIPPGDPGGGSAAGRGEVAARVERVASPGQRGDFVVEARAQRRPDLFAAVGPSDHAGLRGGDDEESKQGADQAAFGAMFHGCSDVGVTCFPRGARKATTRTTLGHDRSVCI